jgi:hypothetical protein
MPRILNFLKIDVGKDGGWYKFCSVNGEEKYFGK